ncbi:MAG: ankyrin repeat domain-containing protein [Alphaproteobacteria bacterium]|nr:ankyrin repeat domain-containing protein [Alphaproteobacteria bacterium]
MKTFLPLIFYSLMVLLLPFYAVAQMQALPSPGQALMFEAIENGDLDEVKHFIEEDSASYYLVVADEYGYTALHQAADFNQLVIAKYLIDKGIDVNAKAGNDVTPIFIATYRNSPEMIKLLLKAGADVNVKSAKGISSLTFAAGEGYANIVEILLKAKANPNSQSHYNGVTALIMAAQNGDAIIVKSLLKAGANPRAKAVNDYDSVDFAKKYLQTAENPTEWQKIIDLLVAKHKTAPPPPPMPRAPRGDDAASQFLGQTDDLFDKFNYALELYMAQIITREDLTAEQKQAMLEQFLDDMINDKIDVDEFIKANGDN